MGVPHTNLRPGWLGPLWWLEVARHTRRGHSTLARCALALLLLLPAYYAYVFRMGVENVDFRNISFAPNYVSDDIKAVAGMKERIALTFFRWSMFCQAIAVLLVTPSYVATSIAEEKQAGTLELFFTTFVTDREVILGKLFSRLLHLAGFLLAGLPIVGLALFWNGTTLSNLLIGYGILLVTLFMVGCIAIFCSVTARTTLGAELASYGLVILVSLVTLFFGWRAGYDEIGSPVAFFLVWLSPEHLERQAKAAACLWVYPWLYIAIGLIFLDKAITTLRPLCLAATDRNRRQPGTIRVVRQRSKITKPMAIVVEPPPSSEARAVEWNKDTNGAPPKPPLETESQEEKPPEVVAVGTTTMTGEYARHYQMVPVGDDPLLWKEIHHGTRLANPENMRLLRYVLLALVALVAGLSGVLLWAPPVFERRDLLAEHRPFDIMANPRGFMNNSLRLVAVLAMTVWCAAVGLRTANTLSQERAQQTLLGLLTLPLEGRREILRAKWVGSLLRYQWLGWVMLATCVAGLFTGMIHPLAAPFLLVVFACHIGFLGSFGLWLSLTVRSQLSVQLCMALVVVCMCTAPLLIALYAPDEGADITRSSFWYRFEDVGASPINSWWFLMSGWMPFDQRYWVTIIAILTGLAVYVGAGWTFWKGACLQFERIQGDELAGRR